jgi:hypothetical protein
VSEREQPFDDVGSFIPPPGQDAVEHFWNAAHEFLSAMRALIDAADAYVEEQRQPRERDESRLHHIRID